jgi:hypothetical protein
MSFILDGILESKPLTALWCGIVGAGLGGVVVIGIMFGGL